jgi:hypothetical protein
MVNRYLKPWPQTADRGGDRNCCTARAGRWTCTRLAGHDGEHQAGGPRGQMYASWPAEADNTMAKEAL